MEDGWATLSISLLPTGQPLAPTLPQDCAIQDANLTPVAEEPTQSVPLASNVKMVLRGLKLTVLHLRGLSHLL